MHTTRIYHDTCPICGSREIAFAFSAKDNTVSGETFEVWDCTHCTSRFTQGIPAEEDIGAYYESEEYISHSNTSKGLINTLYQQVRAFTLVQKRKLIERLSGQTKGTLLDIGCGTGEFLREMQQHDWEVKGLEPSPAARDFARQSYALQVDEPDQLFGLSAQSADVITMWHVLEHVHRLSDTLNQIHDLLRPDGLLLIAVPNFTSSDADHYREHWAAYDVPRHLYHFSPRGMKMLLEKHRFSIQEHRPMPFDAFYVSMLSEQYAHGHNRLPSAFLTGLRSWWRAGRDVQLGSSVLYVVKKGQKG